MIRFNRAMSMFLALIASASGSAAAWAQQGVGGPATYSVVVRHADPHPRSRRAARAMLARIGDAAMEACGASPFSLREVKEGVRASACWRDSVADAVARIGDPMLADAYDRRHMHTHG